MPIIIHAVSQDGLWSVIEAKDFMPGIGRSRTRDTPGDALKATWDPFLITPVGKGSQNKFVLVRTMDLSGNAGNMAKPTKRIGDIITPEKHKKTIPDFPHKCHVCGGRMVILFSSVEHEGGMCPGPSKKNKSTLF